MKFSQSLAAKLGATFGGVLLLMLVSVLVSGIGLWKFAETIDTITQKTSFRASAARDLRKSYSMLGQYARNAAILSDLKQIDAEVAAYQIERKRFGQTLQDISDNATRLGAEQEEIATHRAIMELAKVVLGSLDKAIQLGASGDSTGAVTTLTMEMRGDEQKLISQFEEFVALQDRLTGIAVKRSEELKFLIYAVLVGTFIGSLCVALLASWKMTRSIVGRINTAVQWAKDIAAGDLRRKAYLHSRDEVGHMLMALESMREQLTSLVADIGVTAEYIQNAAAEVSVGNIDLSARTEASAASIEKANAWLTGLVEVVNETSQVSTEAQDLSVSATEIARTGETLVVSAIQRMQDISKNAIQISAITSVIDGIAFQTNILALNAAVEAARAGEHGRGFAVVAGEVRLLASRAGDAAKQIRQLIETSAACTRDGSEVVDRAGKSMHEVCDAVEKLGVLVQRIQESGVRQSRELTEVASSISSIEVATQQNAALVEESAAAASALKDQSLQLTTKTKYFTLEEPMPSTRLPAQQLLI